MSLNYSSLINDSSSVQSSSANLSFPFFMHCFISRPSSIIFSAFTITYASGMLPLVFLILCHWREKRSTSSASAMSHSDFFTYNEVVMELLGVTGCIVSCGGIYLKDLQVLALGLLPGGFLLLGGAFFHILTCVERYLAVVHLVIYRSSKSKRGVFIRNLCVSCGWLLNIVGMGFLIIESVFSILDLCLVMAAITIVSFCSLSVLCVLVRPGPGDQSGDREKVDQLKKRAFYTIIAILGVLVLRFTAGLTRSILFMSNRNSFCEIMTSSFWFYMPSSFVLPLLFLHRSGTLVCCKINMK